MDDNTFSRSGPFMVPEAIAEQIWQSDALDHYREQLLRAVLLDRVINKRAKEARGLLPEKLSFSRAIDEVVAANAPFELAQKRSPAIDGDWLRGNAYEFFHTLLGPAAQVLTEQEMPQQPQGVAANEPSIFSYGTESIELDDDSGCGDFVEDATAIREYTAALERISRFLRARPGLTKRKAKALDGALATVRGYLEDPARLRVDIDSATAAIAQGVDAALRMLRIDPKREKRLSLIITGRLQELIGLDRMPMTSTDNQRVDRVTRALVRHRRRSALEA